MLEQSFQDAMSQAGIPASHKIIFDGNLRRYHVAGQKRGRRNGWYRFVRMRDDFAWGVFGCNKTQLSVKWSSKERNELTEYDKKQWRKKQDEIEKDYLALQARVAAKANQMWLRSSGVASAAGYENGGAHPYLMRKGVRNYGLREMHGALVVPLSVDNYIVSLQFITAEGDKRFLTDGQKKGASFTLGDTRDGVTTIWVAEGYATAASIHEALAVPVVMAFDAGNLLPVAQALRARWPERKIIIAADNDQWTRGNPGLSKAQEAADTIGGTVKYPDKFLFTDESHPTDWNDFHRKYGLKVLAQELLGINLEARPVVRADKWTGAGQLLEGKEFRAGFPLFDTKSKRNAYLFLKEHESFKGAFAHNIFSDKILMMRCPSWENPAYFMPREMRDTDAAMIVSDLEWLGIRSSKDTVSDYINQIAFDNQINPPWEHFESLVWDGNFRIEKWLTYYLGAEFQDPEYLRLVGAKWLMGAVARIYQPGTKFDNVLVLEGAQGIKKTSVFEQLATFGGESYFLEFSGDVMAKDSMMLMQGKVIVEMAELASVRKSQVEDMKAFVSRRVDEYRPPYGRSVLKRPRMFVLGGGTNKTTDYLEDPTGARRIWPVRCGDNIDLDALTVDCGQLWAEAVAAYKSGVRIWLEGDEIVKAREEQSERQQYDGWQEKIMMAIGEDISAITTTRAAEMIGLQAKDLNSNSMGRIRDCLAGLGWKEHRPKGINGERGRIWKKNS